MLPTSARLLRLLSLLQVRREWSGAELAGRLEVGERTVRRDVDRLRTLGYPVRSQPGVQGGYQLEAGTAMPPLLLDDEEAVAVAVSLRTAAGGSVAGIEETSLRALAKLEQVLPQRLRRRVTALQRYTVPIPQRGGVRVDADLLAELAGACRDHDRLRLDYRAQGKAPEARHVEPNRLLSWGARWYLLAWDLDREDWRTFRVDRIRPVGRPGPKFAPREPPAEDLVAWVAQRVGTRVWPVQITVRVDAPAVEVRERMGGVVEATDDRTSLLTLGGTSLAGVAVWLGALGADLTVVEPPQLRDEMRLLAERYARAAGRAE
ncbi:MAG: helix-turn-helix transcriptional regulator [Candidatus Dormibacteraceae bacterium]